MKRYDEIGRGHWAAFLARHDVPHRALPLDSRFERPTWADQDATAIDAAAISISAAPAPVPTTAGAAAAD